MSIEIAVRHGPYTFRVVEDDIKTAVTMMSALQELPKTCPVCDARLRFDTRVAQGNAFYSLVCSGEDPHRVDLGQYKDDERQLYYDREKPWLTRAEIQRLSEQRNSGSGGRR